MSRRARVIVGIAISLACLFLVVREIDLQTLWATYREGNYAYLLPALVLLLIINWVRAYRWRLLMHPDIGLALRRLFHVVNIGYLFNNVLPAKVGEVVRAYLVGRLLPGGLGQAASSLVIERLLDVLTLVVLLVVLIPFVAMPTWVARAGLTFGLAAMVGTALLLVLAALGERGLNWVWYLLGRLPLVGHRRVRHTLANLLRGFRVLLVWRLLPGVVLSSLLIWLGYATFNYVVLFSFGLGHLPFAAATLVLCATGFSMVVPSSPGAMGVFEAAAVLALAVYDVDQSQAFGYAFGLRVFTNVVLILLGLWGLRVESLSFGQVRRQARADGLPDAGATAADTGRSDASPAIQL